MNSAVSETKIFFSIKVKILASQDVLLIKWDGYTMQKTLLFRI